MKWVALFSQTGSEIRDLSKKLGRSPDLIMTNNRANDIWTDVLKDIDSQVLVFNHVDIMNRLKNYQYSSLVTLHGYLRIIPEDVCHACHIVNGHPGLISEYPWLKGKDPQERIEDWMTWIGSVCHRVVPEVDAGEILTEDRVAMKVKETFKGNYYNILRHTSLRAWEKYFEEYQT